MEPMKKRGARDLENVSARALKLAAMGRISDEDAGYIRTRVKQALACIAGMEERDCKGDAINGQA